MSRTYQGLPLPAHKQHSRDVAIVIASAPDVLVLPLNQQGASLSAGLSDGELTPCVAVNDHVNMGQTIALPGTSPSTSLGACLHSPVSGTVLAIEACPTALGDQTLLIVIGNDHLDTRDPSLHPVGNWQTRSPIELCKLLALGGIVGLGGAVFPTATKLAAHQQHSIGTLLINGVECEPYISCDDRLMRERAALILSGAQILLHAAQAQTCVIAIEADKPEAIAAMQNAVQALADTRFTVHTLPTAYPGGDEGQLITQLLQREIPRGGLPAQIGVIVQNVATAYACAQWVLHAEPLISRIVTLTGPGIPQAINAEVRLGTSMYELIRAYGSAVSIEASVIMGGAMMGRSVSNAAAPIVKASNCLIVAAAPIKPTSVEMPCIRCGECAHACPANLLPQQLLMYARKDHRAALQELGLFDCIECGCCDYVCPSNIPLVTHFRVAKRALTT
ncbi:MAG: electron transport complex subunit RsxC [Steroidobacteraceae bacterium]